MNPFFCFLSAQHLDRLLFAADFDQYSTFDMCRVACMGRGTFNCNVLVRKPTGPLHQCFICVRTKALISGCYSDFSVYSFDKVTITVRKTKVTGIEIPKLLDSLELLKYLSLQIFLIILRC